MLVQHHWIFSNYRHFYFNLSTLNSRPYKLICVYNLTLSGKRMEMKNLLAENITMKLAEYIMAFPDDHYPEEEYEGDPSNFGGVWWSDGWC